MSAEEVVGLIFIGKIMAELEKKQPLDYRAFKQVVSHCAFTLSRYDCKRIARALLMSGSLSFRRDGRGFNDIRIMTGHSPKDGQIKKSD